MGLTRTVSEINGYNGQKTNFSTPRTQRPRERRMGSKLRIIMVLPASGKV